MSSQPDPEQTDRDELVIGRAVERDLQREPAQHRHPRCVRPDRRARRAAFEIGVQDSVNRVKEYTIRVECPACRGPVFVPVDSDREVITCNFATCGAELVTRRTIDGVDLVRRDPPDGAA